MTQTYFPPTFKGTGFNCVHCKVYAAQEWAELTLPPDPAEIILPPRMRKYFPTGIYRSLCSHCRKPAIWYEEKMVFPDESPELPHPDLPADCLAEYQEAGRVFSKSPRAAAALLRLCVEKLLPHLGETGKDINDTIKSLVKKGLPPFVQQALDYCRVIGNNAVHPGAINLNDTPEIAQQLFRMVNFIVNEQITRPREIEDLYQQLPQNKREAIDERDKGKPEKQS